MIANTTRTNVLTGALTWKLAWRIGWWRLPIWSLYLGLTAVLLAYPVDPKLQWVVVPSPELFPNLPLFGALFYLWAASLLLLLFASAPESRARWERLALVATTALVYRGFWTILSPLQLEAIIRVTDASIWQSAGHVVAGPGAYSDHPGTSVTSSVLSQVTGLELFGAIQILTLFITLLIALGTYVGLLGLLRSSLFAAVGSVAILEGSVGLYIYHQPGPTALAFLVLFFAVLYEREQATSPSRMLMVLLLLAAATVTHVHISMHFFFVFAGLWFLRLVRRSRREEALPFGLLALPLLIPLAWNIFWGVTAPKWVITWAGWVFGDPLGIRQPLADVYALGQANFGESAPGWYSATRELWLVALYAAGGLLWLRNLSRLHKLDGPELKLTAGLFGIALLTLLSSAVSPSGLGELLRLLQVLVFFTTPLLLLALEKAPPRLGQRMLIGFAAIMVLLSLPSFLANYIRINSDLIYPSELSAGALLQTLYGSGREMRLVTKGATVRPFRPFLYDAIQPDTWSGFEGADLAKSRLTPEDTWRDMDDMVKRFTVSAQDGAPSLFLVSPREALEAARYYGVSADHPRWQQWRESTATATNMVYDSGVVQVYGGIPRGLASR